MYMVQSLHHRLRMVSYKTLQLGKLDGQRMQQQVPDLWVRILRTSIPHRATKRIIKLLLLTLNGKISFQVTKL